MAAKNQNNFLNYTRSVKEMMQNLNTLRDQWQNAIAQHYDIPYDDVPSQDGSGWLGLADPAEGETEQEIVGINITQNDYILGIIMLEQLEAFFGNLPVTQGDYQSTLQNWIAP